jgi:hypothetical protein
LASIIEEIKQKEISAPPRGEVSAYNGFWNIPNFDCIALAKNITTIVAKFISIRIWFTKSFTVWYINNE